MTRGNTLRVDQGQPIDPTHPLTRNLEGFWLALPHLVGGSRLYDLTSISDHSDGAGLPYKPHFGDLYFKARDPAGAHSVDATGIRSASEYSFLLVQYLDEVNLSRGSILSNRSGFDALNIKFGTFFDSAYPNSRSYRLKWTNSGPDARSVKTTTSYGISPNERNVIIGQASENEDQARLWRNGEKMGEVSQISSFGDSSGNALQIGSTDDDAYYVSVLLIASTWWTETDVHAITNQARRGFPDMLNMRPNLF